MRIPLWVLAIVLLPSFAGMPRAQDDEAHSLRAGAAVVDISPVTLPALRNGGFLQASSDHVDDPLSARCLVISDGNETIAIVIVDSCMFSTTLCDDIKLLATRQTGIPTNRILISATHTHSAPSAMAYCLGCRRDDAYVQFVPARVAQAITDAHATLRPAKLGFAAVDGSPFTSCRRWIKRSDRMGIDPFGARTVRAMMNPGYQNPDYVCPSGPIDPWLSVLSVVSAKDDTPICVLANLSMHYFGGNPGFSADYFGEVARLLEARIGKISGRPAPDFVGIMSQGTSGDLHWINYTKPRQGTSRQQYSEDVANRILQSWKTIEHRSNLTLAMAEQRLTIARRTPSPERLDWARLINRKRGDVRPRNQVEVYAEQAAWIYDNPRTEVVLQAVRIGALGLTAIPNEVYGITGLKLKRQSPLAMTFNLELANGGEGYIPPPEQHRLGGYTTWPARSAGLDEQAEPLIVETLLQLLESVSAKKRKPVSDATSDWSRAVTGRNPVAYWRLGDMDSTQVTDETGKNHAEYKGGVAMYLPGPDGSGFISSDNGNQAVYLAGGHIAGRVPELRNDFSVSMWFWNGLPADAREVTGTLLCAGSGTLLIAGRAAGEQAGRLVFEMGQQSCSGKTSVSTKGWHHLTLTRKDQRVRVYLDGSAHPEIDTAPEIATGSQPSKPLNWILIGTDGNASTTFDGKVDEVAVFDQALSADDIADLYSISGMKPPRAPKPTITSGLNPSDEASRKQHSNVVLAARHVDQHQVARDAQADKPEPTDVADALSTIHVPEGFEVQLVAAEPQVMDPVAIDWGPNGKLWVVEMADYPLGIDGNGKAGGRVRCLQDTNDDGHYDAATLFAEGLSFPTGVLSWGDGILVTAAPELLYLEDSTGDGKADLRRVLYSGFLAGNQQLRVNGLRWGLDNWVYCASGSHHAGYGKENRIVSCLTGSEHQLGSRDFRIRPDTGAFDPQSGPSQYGRNRDDWGSWFGVQNSHPLWHYVLADHNIRRNPHFAPPDPKWQVVTPVNPRVYPASKRQKRFHSFGQSGRFTSACSAMIYRDELLFNRGHEQHAFTCEPFHNLVQHNLISDDGVSFRFRRDPAEATTDFFASEDRWCRPVMVRTGPDGALWVVDIYRYMIEHPQFLPQHGQDELREWFRSGDDRGRIYRIVRRDRPARQVPRLADHSPEELVAALESPNGWQRDTAQRMLVRRGHPAPIAPLQALAKDTKQPLSRMQALWTLDGLGALPSSILEAALEDNHSGVRRNAVRIAARGDINSSRLAHLTEDSDAKVRLELAATLGAYDDRTASLALASLALRSQNNPYIAAAVMSSLNPRNVSAVLEGVADSSEHGREPVLLTLIGQAVALGNAEVISRVIDLACSTELENNDAWQFTALARSLDGLVRRNWSTEQLSQNQRDQIAHLIRCARVVTADQSEPEESRTAAMQLLAHEVDRIPDDFELMRRLLIPQSPVAVQRAVVARLAQRTEPAVADILLSGWRAHSPLLRTEILNVLASRRPWAELLRDRLESGAILVSELSAPLQQNLLKSSNNSPEWQAALAAKTAADRDDVLRHFQPALNLQGNPQRGVTLFRRLCINCHQVKGEGHEVGPNLASITNTTNESLLTSILDPNAGVDARYLSYVVVTNSGRSFSGMLETETGSSITLIAAEAKRETILRDDVDELQASTKSLMPEGLEKDLNPQDLSDVMQFIREIVQ